MDRGNTIKYFMGNTLYLAWGIGLGDRRIGGGQGVLNRSGMV